jgi:hypothetical protein
VTATLETVMLLNAAPSNVMTAVNVPTCSCPIVVAKPSCAPNPIAILHCNDDADIHTVPTNELPSNRDRALMLTVAKFNPINVTECDPVAIAFDGIMVNNTTPSIVIVIVALSVRVAAIVTITSMCNPTTPRDTLACIEESDSHAVVVVEL